MEIINLIVGVKGDWRICFKCLPTRYRTGAMDLQLPGFSQAGRKQQTCKNVLLPVLLGQVTSARGRGWNRKGNVPPNEIKLEHFTWQTARDAQRTGAENHF